MSTVTGKIALLEKALADSLELQKQQMSQVQEELAAIKVCVSRAPTIPLINIHDEETPSKKRKS